MRIAFCLAFLVSCALAANIELDPLSDEFIEYINSQPTTWKAGRNFDHSMPRSEIRKKLGYIKRAPAPGARPTVHREDVEIPETFDARANWPECENVISTIVDQSSCGSCWAVSAASAMSDRRCIASKGSLVIPVSAEDVMSCCGLCGFGCGGGFVDAPWDYWGTNGIVTGGLYNSSVGCKPYSLQTCDHHVEGQYTPCSQLDYNTPECTRRCTNGNLEYRSELTRAQPKVSWLATVEDIQREIIQNGPVSAGFDVYSDFLTYKSGVYQRTAGTMEGGHAVRILGWGTEDGTPYWLIANSWNEDWGDKGLFKFLRGQNHLGIEEQVYGALPRL